MRACAVLLAVLLASTQAEAGPPSITLIVADDLAARDVSSELMPRTHALTPSAVAFRASFSPLPLCVPSRVSLLTGLLPRHHGIRENDGAAFTSSTLVDDTIATRLQARGYATALVGKFLNNTSARPPGWDLWLPIAHNTYGAELQTATLAEQAEQIHATSPRPLFLYLVPVAPHGPLEGPSWCQARDYPPPPSPEHAERWHQRVTAICALDDLVADRIEGRLADEWVIFTSDHGFIFEPPTERNPDGREGKRVLHLDAAQMPLFVWGPRVVPGERRELVSLIDVSATVLRIGRASRRNIDGQSLWRLLLGRDPDWIGRLEIEGVRTVEDEE